jgi:putative transposase
LEEMQRLREEFPFLGKGKLTVLLRREGFTASSSTVGRILRYLKTRGLLREEEKPRRVSATKSPRGNQRPHAQRKPKDYEVASPGDLIAIDTLDIRPLPGKVYKQFTAGDLVSRWAYSSLHLRATANLARVFLEELRKVPPFQCGPGGTGGSEFYGEFEGPRRNTVSSSSSFPQGLPYPWNGGTVQPDLPGGFSPHYEDEVDLVTMRFHLKRWTEEVYNRKRPHWSLGYRSPWEYLRDTGLVECPT